MTTGEKLTFFRKKKNLTQEQLAELLNVSRQSVSRWEMDAAFPETEKLVKLSRILECSIDFLLNGNQSDPHSDLIPQPSARDCQQFIHECGYFFLATSFEGVPRLRPMGFLYADDKALYFSTDRRKNVFLELSENPQIELSSYNLNSGRWIRISGAIQEEHSGYIREEMMNAFPMIRQEFVGEKEVYLVIFRIQMKKISVN